MDNSEIKNGGCSGCVILLIVIYFLVRYGDITVFNNSKENNFNTCLDSFHNRQLTVSDLEILQNYQGFEDYCDEYSQVVACENRWFKILNKSNC